MKYGSIAAGSKETLNTAKDILIEGGNAFDATVGAIFTSMTSEFALTGAGGGGILISSSKNQHPMIYDFFVNYPLNNINSNLDFKKIKVDFGNTSQDFFIGKGSCAVPGNIAGLLQVHNEKGILPLDAILQPAIKIAKDGVILSKYQSYINKLIKPILTDSKMGKQLFIKNKSFLEEGDTFKNPNFSTFLEELILNGKDFFYKGEAAKIIENTFSDGGMINKNNLNNYKVFKRKPLKIKIGEYEIFTNPAPAYGGTLVVFLLKILKKSKRLNSNIIDLIKAMELTSVARLETCMNPFDEMEISNCLKDSILNKYLKSFNNENFNNENLKKSDFGSTTHISVIDKFENIVSATTTNGEGSGIFIPEFGILMNNMLGERDLNPFGFHQWKHSGRLPTMLCPTIIMKNNKPLYALGSGGSNRIRSAIVQIIINLIVKKMNLKDAVESPRIHLENKNLFIEKDVEIPKNEYTKKFLINKFNDKSLFFGGANCVGINQAVGDSRRGGVSEIF